MAEVFISSLLTNICLLIYKQGFKDTNTFIQFECDTYHEPDQREVRPSKWAYVDASYSERFYNRVQWRIQDLKKGGVYAGQILAKLETFQRIQPKRIYVKK